MLFVLAVGVASLAGAAVSLLAAGALVSAGAD
jgi:hypothetical protein